MSDPLRGWKETTVGEVLSLEYGKPLPKEDRVENGKHPAFGANGVKCRTDRFHCDEPSIIVGRKGSAGELTLTPDKFWPLDVTFYADFDRTQHDLMFLYHLLSRLELPSLATGVKPGINRNRVYEIPVRIPPLSEQRRIVSVLDAAFAGLATAEANTRQNLTNARELFAKQLEKILKKRSKGWVSKTIGDLVKIRSGDFLPRKQMDESGKIPVYGGNGQTGFHTEANLHGENIIIGRVGAQCGNVHYVEGSLWLTDNAFYVRDFHFDLDTRFVAKLLRAVHLRQYARQTAQPVISFSSIKSVILNFPESRSEQSKISAMAEELEEAEARLGSIANRKLAALAALKQSLLHRAFRGELSGGVPEASAALTESVAS